MNKAILCLAALFLALNSFGQSQLENSYFAAWEDMEAVAGTPAGVYQEPVGSTWATSNEASMYFLAEPSVKKTTDAYMGEYAALIQTIRLGTTNGSGTLFTGKFKLDVLNPLNSTQFGIPFTNRPVYLKGFYKYLPIANDSCRIASYLTKWNSISHRRDTIAAASISREQSMLQVSTYTEFDIFYHYYSSNAPDSITVIFASSADGANYNASVGTKLYIDEIGLEYFPMSTEKTDKNSVLAVFPNPASDYLIIESGNGVKTVQLKIYNSTGSLMKNKLLNSTKEELLISDLPAGMYFYSVSKSDGKIESGKFYIE
jgi:hypothetical protein